jgi:hypothetical protein
MVQMSQKEQDIQMMLAAGCHLGTKNVNFQMERYGALLFLFFVVVVVSFDRAMMMFWIREKPRTKGREEVRISLWRRGRVDAKVRREIRGWKCVRLVFLRPN